ncbi:MAG: phosphate ABC transporter permease PstA [Gaiellaceae bacterium]|jgi:phosphate transport system permease protein
MSAATPEISLRPGGRLRRRLIVNRCMEAIGTAAALLAVAALGLVIVSVGVRGAPALSWHFLTTPPSLFGGAGGISSAIVGSLLIVGVATALALPLGVLTAIYLTEFASRRVAAAIQLVLDVMNGLPTIVTGIFVYGLIVIGSHQKAYAGALALAIVMLPVVARSAQEVLLLVPATLREAGLALGVSRWRTVLGVILPTTWSGIITGTVIAAARAAGETAPLLFTTSIFNPALSTDVTKALPNIPVLIFTYSEQPDKVLHEQAWAAAFVLMLFILAASLLARGVLARSQRRLRP